jgi:hypothetical protein
MPALSIHLPGNYYDSQIYSGRLYLWGLDGTIRTIDWKKLINTIRVDEPLKLALRYGFLNGNALYSEEFRRFLQDAEVQDLLRRRFQRIAENPIEFSEADLQRSQIRLQVNPFPFPHADTAVHYREMFVGERGGVHRASLGPVAAPIGTRPEQLWDGPAVNLASGFHSVAIAAGSEGLFRLTWDDEGTSSSKPAQRTNSNEPKKLDDHHATLVHWMYDGLFSTSYSHQGYLVDFARVVAGPGESRNRSSATGRLGTFSTEDLFGRPATRDSFVWGARDKVYAVAPGQLDILEYDPKDGAKLLENLPPSQDIPAFRSIGEMQDYGVQGRFIDRGPVDFNTDITEVVRADSAPFGVVLEFDERVLIVTSTGEQILFNEEPVNWRVFPDSKLYTNQLHVIRNDSMSIYSFTEDYFVDQDTKRFGIRPYR